MNEDELINEAQMVLQTFRVNLDSYRAAFGLVRGGLGPQSARILQQIEDRILPEMESLIRIAEVALGPVPHEPSAAERGVVS